ncbi:hypothetical protein EDB19DRAFT_1896102 [Suillus lakei]|nr:hypothetical protein EDB19DRAFT_1896102 [Suillus lakei]
MPSGSSLPRKRPSNFRRLKTSSTEEASDNDDDSNADMKGYGDSIRKTRFLDYGRVTVPTSHWTVVHISLTPDKSTLFISRQNESSKPLMFCVPLKGRREPDEDEHLTFDDAVKELAEIIRSSDQGTRNAVNVRNDDPQARVACPVPSISADLTADRHARLEKVFKRILPPPDKKQKHYVDQVTVDLR